MPRPAVFLDRDGTINVDKGYLSDVNELDLIPHAAEAIARLNRANLPVVVVSNQSGLARGLVSLPELEQIHQKLQTELAAQGARLDGIYFCPHWPEGRVPELSIVCTCRKPAIGLVERAGADLDLDLRSSYVVGDKLSDVELGQRMGGRGVLVLTGLGRDELQRARSEGLPQPELIAPDLGQAVALILAQHAGRDAGELRDPRAKLFKLDAAASELRRLRGSGVRTVLAWGGFELLHAAELRYLQAAAGLGERLFVAVLDDAGIQRSMGSGRPLAPADVRAELVAHLDCVDGVFIAAEQRLRDLLSVLGSHAPMLAGRDSSSIQRIADGLDLAARCCADATAPETERVIAGIRQGKEVD